VCDPPCQNYGVCVGPNSCDCPPGYPGVGCSGANLHVNDYTFKDAGHFASSTFHGFASLVVLYPYSYPTCRHFIPTLTADDQKDFLNL
ncbi:hypothetical protein XENOCAPTIV_030156, partial [Xenoophorus captivus]